MTGCEWKSENLIVAQSTKLDAKGVAQMKVMSYFKIQIRNRSTYFILSKNPSQVCPPYLFLVPNVAKLTTKNNHYRGKLYFNFS